MDADQLEQLIQAVADNRQERAGVVEALLRSKIAVP
jgi:hypothetical protein